MPRQQFYRATAITSIPNEQFTEIEESISDPVAVGATEQIFIYAPPGTIGIINALKYQALTAPTGATTGEHQLYVGRLGRSDLHLFATQVFNESIAFFGTRFKYFNLAEPADEVSQAMAIKEQIFDEDSGILLTYKNATDVVQNNSRDYKIYFMTRRVK